MARIQEQCTCGAQIIIHTLTLAAATSQIRTWRTTHPHKPSQPDTPHPHGNNFANTSIAPRYGRPISLTWDNTR